MSTKYFFKKENYEPKSWEFSINVCLFKGLETTIHNLNNNILGLIPYLDDNRVIKVGYSILNVYLSVFKESE